MNEIEIKLDFRSKKPLSEQLQQKLRQIVEEKKLKSGDQLPAVRQLADQLRVNFNTVARAYRALDKEGIITTQQGRGTYVVEQEKEGENIYQVDQQTQGESIPEDDKILYDAEPQDREAILNQWINKILQEASLINITIDQIQQELNSRLSKPVSLVTKRKKRKAWSLVKKRIVHPIWNENQWLDQKQNERRISNKRRTIHVKR